VSSSRPTRVRQLTTRELASALGVSESSLKRWVDSGRIAASRTEGGHRRIELAEAMRFIRDTSAPLARPELLDLPEITAARERGDARLVQHLLAGDAVAARGYLIGRYLAGASIAELGDGPIREAMHALGELWRHEQAGVYLEHQATDICLQAVAQLRGMIDDPVADAPAALGGAPAGDPYLLPTQLAAMAALESGLRAINLGPDTPVAALRQAVDRHHPRLVWLSVTTPLSPQRARGYAAWLAELPATITAAVGGQQASTLGGLPEQVRRVSSLVELAELAAAADDREQRAT
jgi:excisionase family DNA binding protein